MNEMSSIGREEWPAITMVVFRNYQWGAEKRNSILWYDDNFVGTELDPHLSYAKMAEGLRPQGRCGQDAGRTDRGAAQGLRGPEEAASRPSSRSILNQELGEPFRRDAMKKPVVVAGIKREDMRPQVVV